MATFRARATASFSLVIVATACAGVAGYLVTWLVYRQAGPATYASFAVFWAALYLVIGALSGIQQEITRATRPIPQGSKAAASRSRNFALGGAGLVVLAIICTAPAWAFAVFPEHGWALVWPLAVGAGSYVFVATLCGSLYGVSQWRSLAFMVATDGLLRLAILAGTTLVTSEIVALAWVVAIPFPLTVMILWPIIRRPFVGSSDLDVGYRDLTWNVARTVLASASTAVLVSGFPLLLGLVAARENPDFVGELIFTITLTRAPLIVTVMSLQSYFIVRFRDGDTSWWQTFVRVQIAIGGGAIAIAGLGWWLGPSVLAWVSGAPVTIDGSLIAVLVASSALVASLCVSASAVLARSQHFIYSLGWVASAVVTVTVMVSPLDFVPRVAFALLLGPLVGLAIHISWLAIEYARSKTGVNK